MGKKQKIVQMFVTLFVVVLCIFVGIGINEVKTEIAYTIGFVPERRKTPDPLSVALKNMISNYQENPSSGVIDIATLTTFPWDRLYIFPQHGSPSVINPSVGRSWLMVDSCLYAVGMASNYERYPLLIFSKNEKVVYCILYEGPENLSFYVTEYDRKAGIPPKEAVFRIDERGIIRQVPQK